MKEHGSTVRSRRVKRLGVALAIAVAGSAVTASGTQAASNPSKGKYGGEVTVGIADTFPGFCVSDIPNHTALGGFRLMYEQLFERTTKGEYVGSLAKSGTPNANFTEWTIELREGIKFHDGTPFNADAAKLNIDLNAGLYNAENPTADAAFVTRGQGFLSTGIGVNANIAKVEKLGDLTIKITLSNPQNDFLGVLYRAGRYVMRAPSQLMDLTTKKRNPNCARQPIGTGPFKFESNPSPDELNVVKNEDYWRKNPNNGDKLPYLDKVSFINIKEPSQRAAAVRKGTVDAASFDGSAGTFVNDLMKRKSAVKYYESKPLWFGHYIPNVLKADSPFVHRDCRLAVANAIDWKQYNKVRNKGLGIYSGSIVTKGHPMYTLKGAQKYNPTLAKEYTAKCKTALGGKDPGWSLYADTSTASQNNAKFVQGYLEAAGFKMGNLYIAEAGIHIGEIYGGPVTKKTLTQGSPAEGGDSAYVSLFFQGSAYSANSKSPVAKTKWGQDYNKVVALGNHNDVKVDELILAAQAEPNAKVATTKWKAMTEYLQAEGYIIPTIHFSFHTFVNNKSKLGGIGKMPIIKGKLPDIVTNKGIDWTGVWKG
jgi:ABC-type transport system substrate-binding protein